jgi:hypothetical protein
MKKILVVVLVALLISLLFNALLGYRVMRLVSEDNSTAAGNFAIANQLFFEALEARQIRVFAPPGSSEQAFSMSGYSIRIRVLRAVEEENVWDYLNFVSHGHECVFLFACHNWDTDRDLALGLLRILGECDQSYTPVAHRVLADDPDDPDVREWVQANSWEYDTRMKKYGNGQLGIPETPTAIEHPRRSR